MVFCQIEGGVGWGVDKKPNFLLDFLAPFPYIIICNHFLGIPRYTYLSWCHQMIVLIHGRPPRLHCIGFFPVWQRLLLELTLAWWFWKQRFQNKQYLKYLQYLQYLLTVLSVVTSFRRLWKSSCILVDFNVRYIHDFVLFGKSFFCRLFHIIQRRAPRSFF